MYLLYVDESGTLENAEESAFVMGGVAIFERQVYFLSKELDELQSELFPDIPVGSIEFHASLIWAGKGPWDVFDFKKRCQIVRRVYNIIANAHHPGIILFGVAVNRRDFPSNIAPRAFEELCMKFDSLLMRMAENHNEQRSILIFDESRFRERFETLFRNFKTIGTKIGRPLFNVIDVPLFTSSKLTRMLQVADFVSNALWRRYEHNDGRSLDHILHRFDQSGGIIHGLVHLNRNYEMCHCPACLSRRAGRNS